MPVRIRPDLAQGVKTGVFDVRTLTATATLDAEDELVLLDTSGGAFTLNLPSATGDLRDIYPLKMIAGSATVRVEPDGSETIDGNPNDTTSLTAAPAAIWIASDGSNWHILGRMT